MVYGFPGTTQEYISSYELKNVCATIDPIRIEARTQKLQVWDSAMHQSGRNIFLKYTSKRASVANGWKKWQGEIYGLMKDDVVAKKAVFETEFQRWATTSNAPDYSKNLLPEIKAITVAEEDVLKMDEYLKETLLSVELIQQGAILDKLLFCFRTIAARKN